MRLELQNFAFVRKADIVIDGITVIGGDNNTGKSTIGKALFSAFYALHDIESKVKDARSQAFALGLAGLLREQKNVTFAPSHYGRLFNFATQCIDDVQHLSEFIPFLTGLKIALPAEAEATVASGAKNSLDTVMQWPREKIVGQLVQDSFRQVFNGQINSLISPESKAQLSLKIKQDAIRISFSGDRLEQLDAGITLLNKAFFYNNPVIIDGVNGEFPANTASRYMASLIAGASPGEMKGENVLLRSMQDEKLAHVYEELRHIVDGKLELANGELVLRQTQFEKPVLLNNLSSGLKAFVLLKLLLENSILRERDILILDEPEIHLHPVWQLHFAELIVLLQKHFNLTTVVTTHSHFFLNAIQTFSGKHQTQNCLKLYYAESTDEGAIFEDVTATPEILYRRMADAVSILTQERADL